MHVKKVILVLTIVLIQLDSIWGQVNDFFPLSIGSQFKYSYYRFDGEVHYRPDSYSMFNYDSGFVFYKIIDSTLQNDSMVVWTVEERDSLFYKWYSSNGGSNSFWKTRKEEYPLFESLRGNHSLRTIMKVWHFYDNVFRYSQNTSIFAIYDNVYRDTMKFRKDYGLVTVTKNISEGGISRKETHIKDIRLLIKPTSVAFNYKTIPDKFILFQNYPNPFNPNTIIEYSIPVQSNITLIVFDLLGREITTLISEENASGHYKVEFNGSTLPSGIYFYRLVSGKFLETKKMILLR